MPTRKIANLPIAKPCSDPDHKPAGMVQREPGVYEHECPTCGNVMTFVVPVGPNWYVAQGRKNTAILTPTGSVWVVEKDDVDLAEWACDILNVGEIR